MVGITNHLKLPFFFAEKKNVKTSKFFLGSTGLFVFIMAFSMGHLFTTRTIAKEVKSKHLPPVVQDSSASDPALLYMRGREKTLEGKYDEALPLLEQARKADPENPYVNQQLAELYLHMSNFEEAETFAKKAVEKDEKNLEYRATLGGIYAAEKKYAEAKEQYVKVSELDPSNQKAPLLIGILEAESGKYKEGIEVLSKAIKENSDNYMAYFYRAKIYLEIEEEDKAKADLDRCITLKPSFVEAGMALGLLYEKLGKNDEAIKTYLRIEGNGRFNKRLAQLYLQKNDFEKALQQLLEYEKAEPDDYTSRVKIGLIYFETKKYDQARTQFLTILKEQPQADNVRFYLAAVYEETRQYDKAITEFKKVTKDSTFYKESMLHVGLMLKDQERYKEGIAFAKKLITESPDIVEFYDMHASFYEAQGKNKQALSVLEDGLRRYPSDEKLLYFQGALFDKLGQRKKGIENMKKILATDANNAHALNFLGYTYAEMGENLDEAEQLLRKALTLRPNDGYIEDSLGWLLFRKGKTKEALDELNKAIALQNDEPVIYEHLGDIYSKNKDFTKASEMYKKAEELSKKDREMTKKIHDKLASLEKAQMPSTNRVDTRSGSSTQGQP